MLEVRVKYQLRKRKFETREFVKLCVCVKMCLALVTSLSS